MISTKLFAFFGMSERNNGGLTFSPSHVYFEGILPSCPNAVLDIFIWRNQQANL
jgi:hypothetical protein